MKKVINKRIGEILIERNNISQDQLALAIEHQKKKGGYISQHLISMGFVSEVDIAECLSSQYGFAYLPLSNYDIPEGVLKVIPLKLVYIYSLLPIDKVGNTLSVVMADPLNEGVVDMLKEITKSNIAVFIGTYSEIRLAIKRYFGEELEKEINSQLRDEYIIKSELLNSFVQPKSYGVERRVYRRLKVDWKINYFLNDQKLEGSLKDISFNGASFICNSPIPIDKNIYSNIVCKFHAEEFIFNVVLQVLRVERNTLGKITTYQVSGFFTFMVNDDKVKFADLLRTKFSEQ
jgi:hypothetical protein